MFKEIISNPTQEKHTQALINALEAVGAREGREAVWGRNVNTHGPSGKGDQLLRPQQPQDGLGRRVQALSSQEGHLGAMGLAG